MQYNEGFKSDFGAGAEIHGENPRYNNYVPPAELLKLTANKPGS